MRFLVLYENKSSWNLDKFFVNLELRRSSTLHIPSIIKYVAIKIHDWRNAAEIMLATVSDKLELV